jgi:hypothetical protein
MRSRKSIVLNTSSGSGFATCAYPTTATGIHVCSPPSGKTVGTPVRFAAAANSFSPLRKLEVWLDGRKISEVFKSWMDFTVGVGAGTHQAVFFSAGYDNALQQQTVNFSVGGTSCPVPTSPGLNVCSPANGSTVTSPVHVLAKGAITGTITRMEVWVDSTKKFSTFSTNLLEASLPVAAGKHTFTFFIVNTAGQKISKAVIATVR